MDTDKAATVCDRIAEGLSLRRACKEIGLNPPTFLAWCDKDAALNEQYAQARTRGYQLLADELLEISDDSSGDTFTDDDGNVRTDNERVARSKLRVDTRKWMLSKMLPKVYGDKLDVNMSVQREAHELSDDELMRIAAGGGRGTSDASDGEKEPSSVH